MTPHPMRRVTLAYARRNLRALLHEVRDRGPVFIKLLGRGRRHGAVLCTLDWVLERLQATPVVDRPTALEPIPTPALEVLREHALNPSGSDTQPSDWT